MLRVGYVGSFGYHDLISIDPNSIPAQTCRTRAAAYPAASAPRAAAVAPGTSIYTGRSAAQSELVGRLLLVRRGEQQLSYLTPPNPLTTATRPGSTARTAALASTGRRRRRRWAPAARIPTPAKTPAPYPRSRHRTRQSRTRRSAGRASRSTSLN